MAGLPLFNPTTWLSLLNEIPTNLLRIGCEGTILESIVTSAFFDMRVVTICLLIISTPLAAEDVEWKKHVLIEAKLGMINSAVAHDWDGDGHVDVLTSLDNHVVLLKGPKWERFTIDTFQQGRSRNKPRNNCMHSCLMDVDSDGDLDFVGSNNTLFWLECPSDPFSGENWVYRTIDDEILGTHCVITGDVNRDGRLDLIANSGRAKGTPFNEALAWLEVPENPHGAPHWIRHIYAGNQQAPRGSHYAGFGDVNRDGRPDIAYGAKGAGKPEVGGWFAWWEQPEDPTHPWKKHLLSDPEDGATNIFPADLNGDGIIDFFATKGHNQGVLWFKGPEFERIEIDTEILNPHSLDLADLDKDGDLDAVTSTKDEDGITAWYENAGDGTFSRHIIARGQGSYDTRFVDMDGDGDLDVLIAGHTSNNVVWLENPGK